jgi:hypothetical protein
MNRPPKTKFVTSSTSSANMQGKCPLQAIEAVTVLIDLFLDVSCAGGRERPSYHHE